MSLVVFPLGSGCPRRLLRPLALSQLLFRRHRLLALVMLLARPLSLTHRIATFILKSPPLPRRLGRLVLWLFFVYVHHCKLVVCLAAVVRMARFGWLLAWSWLFVYRASVVSRARHIAHMDIVDSRTALEKSNISLLPTPGRSQGDGRFDAPPDWEERSQETKAWGLRPAPTCPDCTG